MEGREIGPPPKCKNKRTRASLERSFRRFCEICFPELFYYGWSKDHEKLIPKIEAAVTECGSLFALSMPRGSGKTTLCLCAVIWALVTGHHLMVALIAAEGEAAEELMDDIKTELETNDKLLDYWPEVCWPIQQMEGIVNRCKGQTCEGVATRMQWSAKTVVLPTVKGSKVSGATIKARGITGRIRGMKRTLRQPLERHGKKIRSIRPTFVVVDDPQTDESAASETLVKKRIRTLTGAVLGLAGPGEQISGVMPCTVIRPNDMADRILDRDKYPQWKGERTKMVYRFPDRMDLWEQYWQIRVQAMQTGGDEAEATEFYRKHRKKMDAGAIVAWPENFSPDEISGVEHAMRLFFSRGDTFWQEYQSEAKEEATLMNGAVYVPAKEIERRGLGGHERGLVPENCTHVTASIDVQDHILWWLVTAYEPDFTSYVVDYGSYPDQRMKNFTMAELTTPLEALEDQERRPLYPGPIESRLKGAITDLVDHIARHDWMRADGVQLQVSKLVVDANYQTELVYPTLRASDHRRILLPSHGTGITAKMRPLNYGKPAKGELRGPGWKIPPRTRRKLRHVLIDTNFIKSFIHRRLDAPAGSPGALTLFKGEPADHEMIASHLTAEFPVRVRSAKQECDEWQERPGRPDNHWLDCLGMAIVGALTQGIVPPELLNPTLPRRSRRRGRRAA